MSDLVNREEAIRQAEEIIGESAGYKAFAVLDALRNLPSAEPEVRTAKVMGDDGYYWHACHDCDQKVEEEWIYCPFCGKRLEWE